LKKDSNQDTSSHKEEDSNPMALIICSVLGYFACAKVLKPWLVVLDESKHHNQNEIMKYNGWFGMILGTCL